MIACALIYVRQGIRIFPCNIKKQPLVKDWLDTASAHEKQINEWWSQNPEALIAIPMKLIDCFTIDCDRHSADEDGVTLFNQMVADNGPLPQHPIVNTPNYGQHHIFRQPKDKIGNKVVAAGIETRGFKPENDGGYIIAPGSVLPDGRTWKLAAGSPSFIKSLKAETIPQAAPWLIDKLRGEPKPEWKASSGDKGRQSGKRASAYAEAALRRCVSELASQKKPGRNNALNISAWKMATMIARGWIGRAVVADALYGACLANNLIQEDGADRVQKTLASGFTAGLASPHADLEERPRKSGNGEYVEPISNAHSWDDPDWTLLDDRRGELPEFPVDVFSPAWQAWLLRASHGAGVRPDHVAVPLLGVASSLIGTARRVRASRSWSEPMTLWACVVAASGDRKTPGLNVTIRCLDLIEKNNSAENSAKRLSHETRVQNAKEALKKWKAERQAALDAKPPQEPPRMPIDAIDPGNFIEPRLYATDPTIERLASLLVARARGMMLVRDELAGLFANMGRYSGGSDRPFWLEAWNGGRHVVERVSGSIVVDHLLVGVIGGFQPDKLARAFAGDEDGMYSRFLYAWPATPDYRPLTNEAAEVEPELQSALTALIRLPSEDVDGVFTPQSVRLSDGAVAKFEEFRQSVDITKRGLDGHERQWFVKGETTVLRLAGTLAYMTWAIGLGGSSLNGLDGITGSLEPKTIDEQFMVAAIRLWREFFWPHARAALRQIGLSDRHKNARRVLRWLKANQTAEISVKDVRREALAQSLDAKETEMLLDGLTKAGWLKRKPLEPIAGPGRPLHRWLVNPVLC